MGQPSGFDSLAKETAIKTILVGDSHRRFPFAAQRIRHLKPGGGPASAGWLRAEDVEHRYRSLHAFSNLVYCYIELVTGLPMLLVSSIS